MWTDTRRKKKSNAHFVVAALALCSIAGTDAPSSEVPRIMLQLPSWDELMIQIGAAIKKNRFPRAEDVDFDEQHCCVGCYFSLCAVFGWHHDAGL